MNDNNKRPTRDLHRYRLYKIIHFLKEMDAEIVIGNTSYKGKGGDGLKSVIERALMWKEEDTSLPDTVIDELFSRKYYLEDFSLNRIKHADYSYITKVELDHVPRLLIDEVFLDKYLIGELSKGMNGWFKNFTEVSTKDFIKANSIKEPIYEVFNDVFPQDLTDMQKNLLLFLQQHLSEVQMVYKLHQMRTIDMEDVKKGLNNVLKIITLFPEHKEDIYRFMQGYTFIYKNYNNHELQYAKGSYTNLLVKNKNANDILDLLGTGEKLKDSSFMDLMFIRQILLAAENSNTDYEFLKLPKVRLVVFYAEWELEILRDIFVEIVNREYMKTTLSIYFSKDGSPKVSKVESNLSIRQAAEILSKYLIGSDVKMLAENDSNDKYRLIKKTLARLKDNVSKNADISAVDKSIRRNLVNRYAKMWGM